MNVKIIPHRVCGKISAIGSKSYAHRVLIAAALLNKGQTKLYNLTLSQDVLATINCLKALGAEINVCNKNDAITKDVLCKNGKTAVIFPPKTFPESVKFDFGESGSTMRFMLPIAAALGIKTEFTGNGNLLSRPIKPIFDLLKSGGVTIDGNCISGKLKCGNYEIESGVSSQFISGTIMAFCLSGGESKLILQGKPVSADYIKLTVEVLKSFGANITEIDGGYLIKGHSVIHTCPIDKVYIEGDWSAAANFLVAGAIGGDVEVCGLSLNSTQGDKAVLDVLNDCGASVICHDNAIRVMQSGLKSFNYYADNTPDIVPALCVLAAYCKGETHIYGVNRLKYKESDRLCAIIDFLNKAQIAVKYFDDTLIVTGSEPVGNEFNSFNDHRIAMCEAILSCYAKGNSKIDDIECVKKSYPEFFEDLLSLGGENYVLF